ncbi:MAG: sigma-70 family RNA polymerase sigma factor [Chloroflexi bacterium]|nr:sigma-70 family RNA polymerase sigma factor [Chloroflexota bacterium]
MEPQPELIHRLRQRDKAALAEVFDRYSDRIYRLGLSLLRDEQAADGVVQDTFVALIENLDTFEGRSSLGTWLYRVAYNNIMGRLRRQKPQVQLEDDSTPNYPLPTNLIDWQELPEDLLSSAEAMQQVQRAIDALSPNLRVVFVLRDIEGLTTMEAATTLGISPGTAKVRLHRARLALRETLANYFQERIIE